MEQNIPLTIEELKQGKLLNELNDKLLQICGDIAKRPDIDKARNLTLKLTIKPAEGPPPNFPMLEYTIETKIPNESTGAIALIHTRNGQFELPARAHDQTTFDNIKTLNSNQ